MFIHIFLGVTASAIMGATMPLFSILFGDVLAILAYEDSQRVFFSVNIFLGTVK